MESKCFTFRNVPLKDKEPTNGYKYRTEEFLTIPILNQ